MNQKTRDLIEKARARSSIYANNGINNDIPNDVITKLGLRGSSYTLRSRIMKHKWLGNRPSSKALRWLFKEVFKDPKTYKYNSHLLFPGGLFTFKYFTPKYRGTSILPWFDRFPLVISLGIKDTALGPRNIGFNLHLLPPKIRIICICYIFEIYKRAYRFSIFYKRFNYPINIRYDLIKKELERFGITFCVRMYIPSLMKEIVRFPYNQWHNAIFIPSQGYEDITAKKLIREWRGWCKQNGIKISENIDWKSVI